MALHYFIFDYMTGTPVEIFRSSLSGNSFFHGVLERAKRDGSWSAEEHEIRPLLDRWLKGDFDPEEDEVPEQEAETYLKQWRTEMWPGRP
ncbi:hypothetical protein [Chitinimonas sp.]|uniref:hypothetical protein n=1 Tax=Chitinimonas sp. TaxID=1934313 RepID=UPI002F928430